MKEYCNNVEMVDELKKSMSDAQYENNIKAIINELKNTNLQIKDVKELFSNIFEYINYINTNIININNKLSNDEIQSIKDYIDNDDLKEENEDIKINNISENDNIPEEEENKENNEEDIKGDTIEDIENNFKELTEQLMIAKECIIRIADLCLTDKICAPYSSKSYITFLENIIELIKIGINDREKTIKNGINNNDNVISYERDFIFYYDEDTKQEYPFNVKISLYETNTYKYSISGFNDYLKCTFIIEDPDNNKIIDLKKAINNEILRMYEKANNMNDYELGLFIKSQIPEFAGKYLYMRDDGIDIKEITVKLPLSSKYWRTTDKEIVKTFKVKRYINVITNTRKYILTDTNDNKTTIIVNHDLNEKELKNFILNQLSKF